MSTEKDINDVFEDLLFAEEKCIEEAYNEGLQKGKSIDNIEGYHLGYHRGAEIGAELGFYYAIATFHLDNTTFSDKIKCSLTNLKKDIDDFPRENVDNVDIVELMTKIRLLYKKTCALLKISSVYPERDNLSF